jgi:hypothetical protein
MGSKDSETVKQTDSLNALSLDEVMDMVIAAGLEEERKFASSGRTTDVSENFTPPPQNKSESTARKPRVADASSLEATSSATLLDAAPITVNSDSVTARKNVKTGKSRPQPSPSQRDNDSSSLVSSAHHSYVGDSPALQSLIKNGDKPGTLLTAPPPNQKAMKKVLLAKTQPEEESTSSGDEDSTPKTKPPPLSDPDDELDVFLHATTHQSQKSVLELLPIDSEDEEEEVEREDMELDEEDEVPNLKGFGHGHSMARAGSSDDDDSDSESVDTNALVKANQVGIAHCM